MSDIEADDDLFALAGGDAPSSDEGPEPARQPSRSPSPAASPVKASTEKSPSPPRKGVAKRKAATATKGTARKRRKTDSDDDRQSSAMASSPNHSLGSGAMSESDPDASPALAGNGVTADFPLEGKFRDEKDRARIMAMTEIEREAVLADRAQQAEKDHQSLALRRMMQQREEANKKKRKADDDSPRKSARAKPTRTNESLEEYKRQREQRGRERKRGEDRKARDKRSPSKDSDADAEGESDVEWDDARAKPVPVDETTAELADIERIRIGRINFTRINFTPGFEDKIVGCFVRVNVGPDRHTGQNSYRMCMINGITEGRPYAMENYNQKVFTTDQYLVLSQGKLEKEFPMIACSESAFTPREFERYKTELANANLRMPSKKKTDQGGYNINALLSHNWTDADIENKLKRSGVAQAKTATFEREHLNRERKAAVSREDEGAIAQIDAKLKELDGPKLAFGTSLNGFGSSPTKPATSNSAPAPRPSKPKDATAAIDAVRKAQLAEKRHKEKLVQEAARKRKQKEEEEAKKAAAAAAAAEARRSRSRGATPQNGEKVEIKEPVRKQIPTFKKKKMDDEIIGGLDLGIDIDI